MPPCASTSDPSLSLFTITEGDNMFVPKSFSLFHAQGFRWQINAYLTLGMLLQYSISSRHSYPRYLPHWSLAASANSLHACPTKNPVRYKYTSEAEICESLRDLRASLSVAPTGSLFAGMNKIQISPPTSGRSFNCSLFLCQPLPTSLSTCVRLLLQVSFWLRLQA